MVVHEMATGSRGPLLRRDFHDMSNPMGVRNHQRRPAVDPFSLGFFLELSSTFKHRCPTL